MTAVDGCRHMLLALSICSLINQWDVEEWWEYPCDHPMVNLVQCCHPGSTLLIQPMMCCPLEEGCCNTSIDTPTPTLHHVPTGQLLIKECSQKFNVSTLVISTFGMISAMGVLAILVFARKVQTEARNVFLDSLYG